MVHVISGLNVDELIQPECLIGSSSFECYLINLGEAGLPTPPTLTAPTAPTAPTPTAPTKRKRTEKDGFDLVALRTAFEAVLSRRHEVDEISIPNRANFLMIKGLFEGMNFTIKIYTHHYVQLFGIKGVGVDGAQLCARSLLDEYALKIINNTSKTNWQISSIKPMSLAANHNGVSEHTQPFLGFNLEVVECIYKCAAAEFPKNICVSRHTRNNGVVVNLVSSFADKKLGSCLFHETGTVQLWGVNAELAAVFPSQLKNLIETFPSSLLRLLKPRRIRNQPSVARKKRNLAQEAKQNKQQSRKKQSQAKKQQEPRSHIKDEDGAIDQCTKRCRSCDQRDLLDDITEIEAEAAAAVSRRDSISSLIALLEVEGIMNDQAQEFFDVVRETHAVEASHLGLFDWSESASPISAGEFGRDDLDQEIDSCYC